MKPKTGNLIFIVDDDPDDRQIILDAFLKNHRRISTLSLSTALKNSSPAL